MEEEELKFRCRSCGGSVDNVQGCLACCRDCGFLCGFPKDSEGFHAEEGEDDIGDD